MINEEGKVVTDVDTIKELALAFHKQFFNQDSYWNIFPEVVVKKKLTVEASKWLSRDVTKLEIKEAMFRYILTRLQGQMAIMHLFPK